MNRTPYNSFVLFAMLLMCCCSCGEQGQTAAESRSPSSEKKAPHSMWTVMGFANKGEVLPCDDKARDVCILRCHAGERDRTIFGRLLDSGTGSRKIAGRFSNMEKRDVRVAFALEVGDKYDWFEAQANLIPAGKAKLISASLDDPHWKCEDSTWLHNRMVPSEVKVRRVCIVVYTEGATTTLVVSDGNFDDCGRRPPPDEPRTRQEGISIPHAFAKGVDPQP